MDPFKSMIVLGVGLLLLSLLFVNQDRMACSEDAKICPDGTVLVRDEFNNCEFPLCPHQDLIRYCSIDALTVNQSSTLIMVVFPDKEVYYNENISTINSHGVQDWHTSIDCSLVSQSVYECPEYNEVGDYKWINCSNTGLLAYCDPTYKRWTEYNCDIEVLQ